jgi:membrane-bound acyltransferase YfiQ involved in biofilm formation
MIGGIIVLLAIVLIAISTYCICINWNGKKNKKNKKVSSHYNSGDSNQ